MSAWLSTLHPKKIKMSATGLATELKTIIDKDHPAGPTVVPLSRIRTDYFDNYRTDVSGLSGEDIKDMKENLKELGQLQNVLGTWLEDGSVALSAGFRRVTAMRHLCLDELISKYNKDNKLKTGDEQYIKDWHTDSYNRILEVKPNEARKLLDNYTVKVDIREYKDEIGAMLDNMAENEARLDVPLSDTLQAVARLKNLKVKQNRIAKSLAKSEATISQYVKINGLAQDIKDVLLDEANMKLMGLDDAATKVHLLQVKGLLEELEKRIGLPKNNERAVPFSHLRDLSAAVANKAGCALEPKQLVETLQYLVKYTDKPIGTPTPEYGQFKNKLNDAINLSNSIRKERELEKTKPKQVQQNVTLDDLSKKQEELETASKAETIDKTLEDLAGAAPDSDSDSTDDIDIESLIDETEEALSGSLMEEVEVDDEDSDIPLDEDLEAIEEEDEDLPSTAGEASITTSKTKTMDKPASKFRQRSPEDVFKLALVVLQTAEDDDFSVFERLASLQTGRFLLDTIGLDAECKKLDDIYEEYLAESVKYVGGLIECAKQHDKDKLRTPTMNVDALKEIK